MKTAKRERVVVIEANRSGYSIDQVSHTMTVGELIGYLQHFEEDDEVMLSFDNGYTYGGIHEYDIDEIYNEEDE